MNDRPSQTATDRVKSGPAAPLMLRAPIGAGCGLAGGSAAPGRRSRLGYLFLVAAAGTMAAACQPAADTKDDVEARPGQGVSSEAMAPGGTIEDSSGALTLAPASYVAEAASGDMYEIQSSQLALQHAQSDEVRRFADRMVTEHEASAAQLTRSIEGTGLVRPTQMQPRHAQMISDLRAARAGSAEFDKLYLDQQMAAHVEAMNLHRGMAVRSDLPGQLSAFAMDTLAKVEGHHAMLSDMPAT